MALEISGKLIKKLPEVTGTGKNGTNWIKQEFVIETQDQYPKKVCMSVWGDKTQDLTPVQEGEIVKVQFFEVPLFDSADREKPATSSSKRSSKLGLRDFSVLVSSVIAALGEVLSEFPTAFCSVTGPRFPAASEAVSVLSVRFPELEQPTNQTRY